MVDAEESKYSRTVSTLKLEKYWGGVDGYIYRTYYPTVTIYNNILYMTVNRKENIRRSSASIGPEAPSFQTLYSHGLQSKVILLFFVRCSREYAHQYLWVPSPSWAGSTQVLQAVQNLMGHVIEFWSMVCWCGKVHTTLPCLAPTIPTQSLRQVGFQTEWRGPCRRPQRPGRWKDPGSLNRVVKGCL